MAEIPSNRGDAGAVLARTALSREVLAPQSPYAGLGVIVVSALAMLMAMASSVLVISARMADSCPSEARRAQQALPVAESWHADHTARISAEPPCGTPQYLSHHDGSISVHYRACTGTTMAPPTPVVITSADTDADIGPVTVQLGRVP